MAYKNILFISFLWLACLGCFHTEPPVRIKRLPKLFTRVDLPEAAYTNTKEKGAPLTYKASEYAELTTKTHPALDSCCDSTNLLPCCKDYWFDLYYPSFDATLNFTYKSLHFDGVSDHIKSDFIMSSFVNTNNRRAQVEEQQQGSTPQGYYYEHYSYAEAGEPEMFFVADTLGQHCLLGSLIFNSAGQSSDSLSPYISFIQKDIEHFIYSVTFH
ncbi:MAG: hypothetical protein DBW80_03445 [Bacteroidetes bacterium]|nr:MAG: hypothetical protein DBW80_03445 [Bacteroidota bacterium]